MVSFVWRTQLQSNVLQTQAIIEAGLIAPLVNLLQNAEFDIKKEAAWAISNATSGGSHDQIKYVGIFIFVTAPSPCFRGLCMNAWSFFLCDAGS